MILDFIIMLVVLSVIAGIIFLAIFINKRKYRRHYIVSKKDYETKKVVPVKQKRGNSYKQEQYLDYLRGSTDTPYYGSNKISQTMYKAFSDYIYELFGFIQGTEENNNKIKIFIGNFDVLPDGDKDITWPRTTTYLFNHYVNNISTFLCVNDNVIVIFHTVKNELYEKIKLFFEKRGIEFKYLPRIKPFSAKANRYVVLNKYSEECTFLHYLLRIHYKGRTMFGFQHHNLPTKTNFNSFKNSSMKKYNLKTEYEFDRYLLSFFINKELATGAIISLDTPDINSIRDYVNKWPGYNKIVWDRCKAINKELNKELKNKTLK